MFLQLYQHYYFEEHFLIIAVKCFLGVEIQNHLIFLVNCLDFLDYMQFVLVYGDH